MAEHITYLFSIIRGKTLAYMQLAAVLAVRAATKAESTCKRNCPNFFLASFFIFFTFLLF